MAGVATVGETMYGALTRATLAGLLLTTLLLAAAPNAAAVDYCKNYGLCPDELAEGLDPRTECGFDAMWVAVDSSAFGAGCEEDVHVRYCEARYYGGGDPLLIGNVVWTCYEVLS